MSKIGFACKWIDHAGQVDGIKPTDDAKQYNTGSTTVAWLKRQSQQVAEEKLWDLMKGNIEAVRKLVEKVGTLDESLRMVRISSDILPVYTQLDYSYFWRLPDVRAYAEKHFAQVGALARTNNVRLSFHPGQFTVLASENPGIVERSIEEFEYHVDMARWMGFGKTFQDLKINVHISGKRGPEGIIDALGKLSPEARHWIRSGEYIQATDDRCQRIIESWRGVRPVIHYSVSREDVLVDHCPITLPDHALLLQNGYKKQKMRAHSNFYWNKSVNDWALTFRKDFDIMCESKAKNLASKALYDYSLTK